MAPLATASLTIGEVAREAGVGVETIRFYERRGLIDEPPRRASGYRQYDHSAIQRLRFIRRAKQLGFSLKEIADLLSLQSSRDTHCEDVLRQLEGKEADIERRVADLRHMQRALRDLARACKSQDPLGDCPILEALERTEEEAVKA